MILLKIVIFAPHPDDEIFGAGGSILKWISEGNEIYIIWLTDGRAGYRKPRILGELEDCEETRLTEEQLAKKRISEADKTAEFLGIKKRNRHFLKFHDQELKNHINEAVEKLKLVINKADRFVIPSNNNGHPDHQATYEIAVRLAEQLNLSRLEFFVYAVHTPLKAEGSHLIKVKVGNLRFKAFEALKHHESQFFTKDLEWQSLWVKEKRRDRFGYFCLTDKGKFFNF
ncbi:MAG: PIG-L deacetylase family protein [Promethearchaeota archaeon]